MARKRTSLADEAYEAIRERIIDGRLSPGTRVTIGPLAEELELSATPIKAALISLERDGLVINHLHRGFFVAEIDRDDMMEIYDVREALDLVAVLKIIASGRAHEVAAQLRKLCVLQEELIEAGDADGYREQSVRFHRELWELSGSTRILKLGESLLGQMRGASILPPRQPGRIPLSAAEHFELLAALETEDQVTVVRAIVTHNENTRGSFDDAARRRH